MSGRDGRQKGNHRTLFVSSAVPRSLVWQTKPPFPMASRAHQMPPCAGHTQIYSHRVDVCQDLVHDPRVFELALAWPPPDLASRRGLSPFLSSTRMHRWLLQLMRSNPGRCQGAVDCWPGTAVGIPPAFLKCAPGKLHRPPQSIARGQKPASQHMCPYRGLILGNRLSGRRTLSAGLSATSPRLSPPPTFRILYFWPIPSRRGSLTHPSRRPSAQPGL